MVVLSPVELCMEISTKDKCSILQDVLILSRKKSLIYLITLHLIHSLYLFLNTLTDLKFFMIPGMVLNNTGALIKKLDALRAH